MGKYNNIYYLNAIEAWTQDMEGYYRNTNKSMPKNIPWKIFADILYAGTIYEWYNYVLTSQRINSENKSNHTKNTVSNINSKMVK